jgi:hypothetical protein
MPEDPLFSSAKFYAIGRNEMSSFNVNPIVFAQLYMEQVNDPWNDWPSIKEFFHTFCSLKELAE